MKKLLLCSLLCISSVSNAWTDISKFIFQNNLSIDETRFTEKTAWINFPVHNTVPEAAYLIAKIGYSCERKTLSFINSYVYDRHGKVIERYKDDKEQDVIPDSQGEYILNRVCDYKKYSALSQLEKTCLANSDQIGFHEHIVQLCQNELKLDGFSSNLNVDSFAKSTKLLGCDTLAGKDDLHDYIDLLIGQTIFYSMDTGSLSKNDLVDHCMKNKNRFESIKSKFNNQ